MLRYAFLCYSIICYVCSAYLACDAASKEGVLHNLQTTHPDPSGSTAVSALLIRGETSFPKALYIANCGDARAVLCEEIFEQPGVYETRRLSYDHKATDAEEIIRIKSLGGMVKNGR
jgi:serine/threonine protein phosphatase PrpC